MLQCNDWLEPLSVDDTLEILRDLALTHSLESGPYRDAIEPLILERRWKELVAYEPSYEIGASASSVAHMRQALGFFTKLESLDIGIDKERVAYEKFTEAEALCRETNDIFRMYGVGLYQFRPRVAHILHAARRKIRSVLGPCPSSLADLQGRFGPGATTVIKRTDASPVRKLAAGLQCSTDVLASGLLPSCLRELPQWTGALDSAWSIDGEGWLVETVPVQITSGNLTFVAKNAKTYRTIVVEPVINGFFQLGIGDLIAKRLRLVGVDIRNQVPNQEAALLGSLYGDLATVDLSSASDTVAAGLVKFLLPADWYALLAAFRTSTVRYRSREFPLDKFSSMGNGYTFPLETLIFWALARATSPKGYVLAYGDDIIIPSVDFDLFSEVLLSCGFLPNKQKSFADGPFRESCGKDYYHGISVRPFYQKKLVSGQTLFTLHNFYKRSFDEPRAERVKAHIAPHLRIYGPEGYGDGHLHSDHFPDLTGRRKRKRGWAGLTFETFTPITRWCFRTRPGDWVSPLYSIYARGLVPLAESIEEFEDVVDAVSCVDTKSDPNGFDRWGLPGVHGYKRTRIYTLG